MSEVANKRLPVTPKTWEELSVLKRPGETFDQLLGKMIAHEHWIRFHEDMDQIERTSRYTPLEELD